MQPFSSLRCGTTRVVGQHAELVALGIRQHDPGLLLLADIHMVRAETQEARHLGRLVGGAKVEMKAILQGLTLGDRHEEEARDLLEVRPYLELVSRVVEDDPSEGFGPPSSERFGVPAVDDDLFPLQAHLRNLRPVL
jgi:hypothetical protein